MIEGMLYILPLVLGEIQLRSSRPSHRSHTWWSQLQSDRIRDAGSCPCIPNLKNRKKSSRWRRGCSKFPHRVENSFQRIKRLRRVVTRYEKLSLHFLVFAEFAAILDGLKSAM